MVSSRRPDGSPDPAELRGVTAPWGWSGCAAIALLVVIAAWLRVRGLATEGFADDEVHKWLAANRYLAGSFGGDDVEHPMLMKSLIALAIAAARHLLAPETLTRLPNAIGGALTVWATALLGRRLFGRAAALLGAALVAVSTTAVGYHRVAKEDVLLALFLTLSVWCFAEARAAAEDGRDRERARWEAWTAVALGAAFASKYFLFYCLVPVAAYLWLRPVSAWRVPARRWLVLVGIAWVVFLALNWTPLMPGTYDYLFRVMRGDIVEDRGVSESLLFMGRLYGNLGFRGDATPIWFFGAFGLLKFLPATAILGFVGLGLALWRRAPAHRIVIVWFAVFHAFFVVAGAKYGRFFISVMPPFLLLAGHAASVLCRALAARSAAAPAVRARVTRAAVAVAAVAIVVPEAANAVAHAPHHRLYVSALAGGDRRVDWLVPHCDYFDAGVREAVQWIARRAEPGAEICSDVDWTVRLYADDAGRHDLVSHPVVAGRCCARAERPCYVIVQPGRLYRHNQEAVANLARRRPDRVERALGHDAARVYRLTPGESPFPPADAPAPATPATALAR